MTKKALVVLGFILPAFLVAANITGEHTKSYGNAVISEITDTNTPYLYGFRCSLTGFPAIVGHDIPVSFGGLALPDNTSEENLGELKKRVRKFLNLVLSRANVLELRDMKRGETFCIVAEVFADGKSVSDMLVQRKLASIADANMVSSIILADKTEKAQSEENENEGNKDPPQEDEPDNQGYYIGSKNSRVFHRPDCSWCDRISSENKVHFRSRRQAINDGRRPCKVCEP